MRLNLKIPYIQVKRPIKINKYHLKSLQDTYSIAAQDLYKSKVQVNKKKGYKTVSDLFRDSPHLDPASSENESVEFR